MNKYIHALLDIAELFGRVVVILAIFTLTLTLFAAALFGGSISVKINNPFWNNKEAIYETERK
ncbi:hypothetical protein [Sphingobacterium suaedae]|uniref:Uncharacterized protein n=1 Tax=Sphingobacterium suaedae TaxID=1686402 RepID=A0ABW5KG07_9SPHI